MRTSAAHAAATANGVDAALAAIELLEDGTVHERVFRLGGWMMEIAEQALDRGAAFSR